MFIFVYYKSPGGYPPEFHRKSTGNDSGKRPESFKFWCLIMVALKNVFFFYTSGSQSLDGKSWLVYGSIEHHQRGE